MIGAAIAAALLPAAGLLLAIDGLICLPIITKRLDEVPGGSQVIKLAVAGWL